MMWSLSSSLLFIVALVLAAVFQVVVVVVQAEGTDEEGLAFLKANKEKEGVIELPSGLQYKILKSGSGAYHPGPSTSCSCHYAGRLIDGTEFDSSYGRGEPSDFAPNQVIKGWTEVMQLMVEGDKWELYIPSELGYGDHGSPPKIPGGAVLIFEMEIMKIKDTSKAKLALKCDFATGEACNDKEKTYIDKVKDWSSEANKEKATKEVERLTKILGDGKSKIKADLVTWLERRLHILKQVVKKAAGEEKEL